LEYFHITLKQEPHPAFFFGLLPALQLLSSLQNLTIGRLVTEDDEEDCPTTEHLIDYFVNECESKGIRVELF
jgi:hypothetical protein